MKLENHMVNIRDKILELRSALFFDLSESVLRLPTMVVHTLDVDEAGQLWFVMPRPLQKVSEFDTSFPAQLNYFRKNAAYSMLIRGKGYIVHDPEELTNWIMLHPELPMVGPASMLVKVTILRIEIEEREMEPSPVVKVFYRLLSWLNMLDTGKTTFEFQPLY